MGWVLSISSRKICITLKTFLTISSISSIDFALRFFDPVIVIGITVTSQLLNEFDRKTKEGFLYTIYELIYGACIFYTTEEPAGQSGLLPASLGAFGSSILFNGFNEFFYFF